MNILLVTSGYPPEHSGSGLRLHQTYTRLKERHAELSWRVLTRRRIDADTRVAPPGPDAVDIIAADPGSGGGVAIQAGREWADFRRRKRGLLTGVDLVHSVGFTWMTVFLCREAAGLGIPVIRELTSTADTGTGRGLGGRAFSAVVRSLNRSAELLIAISPRLEHDVRASGATPQVWCRPNPVDTTRFRLPSQGERARARARVLERAGWSDGDVILLHVGHIRPNKNQLLLVQALRRLPSRFKLLLLGPAHAEDQPYLEAIQREVSAAGLQRRVLVEPLFHSDVERYMAGADLFAFPSKREGLGNVMLEALCSGLPVAASRLPGVTDWIVSPERNGALFELSPEDAAAAILQSERLCGKREEIAREAADRFGYAAIDDMYWNFLQTLIARASGRRTPYPPSR